MYEEQCRVWEIFPPADALLAAQVGFKPKKKKTAPDEDFFRMLGIAPPEDA